MEVVDHPVARSGGTLSTAGNLVFQGRADGKLVAYRATDGSVDEEVFKLSNQDYGLLITAYMVPYTLGYLVSGQLIDRWGTRRCATIFLLGMSIATVACGLARTFHELLAARVGLGIAESGVVPSIMVLITKWYPRERRGFVVTMHQALQSIGPVITAPLVAGLTLSQGWRTSFLLPGVIGFALALTWYLSDRVSVPSNVVDTTKPKIGFDALRFVPRTKNVVLGLVSSKLPQLESQDALVDKIEEAGKFMPLQNLALSPQCGFASTMEGNLLTEDQQWRKLDLVAKTARQVWQDA